MLQAGPCYPLIDLRVSGLAASKRRAMLLLIRLPMRGRSLTARALSRYFLDEGVTSYTHVSDQHSTYGTQIIVSTERDATFTLDEILGNTTELPIAEHTTDSHGQTLATFALFDLVGLRLSPRIAKLTEKRLWRPHPASHYSRWPNAGPLLEHHAKIDLIEEHWEDLLRVGGSLKLGHVSAALLIARLQAGSRQHPLAKALLEYGKLLRTVHALRWFTDEAFRRRIGRQLNRGEALNDLRRFIFFAHRGTVRYPHQRIEDQKRGRAEHAAERSQHPVEDHVTDERVEPFCPRRGQSARRRAARRFQVRHRGPPCFARATGLSGSKPTHRRHPNGAGIRVN